MGLDLDVSNTGVLAQSLLEAPGARTAGIPIYWDAAHLPSPLPDEFIVIEPLYPLEDRAWGQQRNATHTIQIRACARSKGASTKLRSQIANLLPPTVFGTVTYGPSPKSGSHYDSILTARTIAGESETQ